MRGLVRPCRFHRYHRHKGRHLIGRQRELAILGRSDPVRQMLRSEIMLPRHIRYHRARCDRLGNNPPLLLIAPPSAADNARYFRVAPNNLRVVTNVDHNVHTILDPKNRDRALLAVTQLCGVKAPLTDLPHQLLNHLLANDAILLARQFCDCLRDRINDFTCFRGIDFV